MFDWFNRKSQKVVEAQDDVEVRGEASHLLQLPLYL
ncbi:BQ5605_C037g11584 [Microbotryum silenes-dioicae]|uniref:BQ5605_C037g11584 protein n=1 Tax=Microbotryum silenes-dioicae TaxID=796604 RepID=A0A2X0PA62_9BASI|nr:BQ5605_C037g11584 [Microbotryum silenes-dioicae]